MRWGTKQFASHAPKLSLSYFGMTQSTPHTDKSLHWLRDVAYPLWFAHGIDAKHGGFYEALQENGTPAKLPIRTMVQARQIYSFCLAARMNILPPENVEPEIRSAMDFVIARMGQPDGSFAHMLDHGSGAINPARELYTQAFILFALSQAYGLTKEPRYRARGLEVVKYLRRERSNPARGFTEIKEGVTSYASNPHMHLLEAAIGWMEVDTAHEWHELADELVTLAEEKFIDPKTGLLAEEFNADWTRILVNDRFVWEPGHQFEWAWLLGNYQRLTGATRLSEKRKKLFANAEAFGQHKDRGVAVDEVWSDLTVKKASARFWPQCEWIKAAVQLGAEATNAAERQHYARSADDGLAALEKYLDQPKAGLWRDTWTDQGEWTGSPVKASSLYHIAGAMAEYVRLRGQLG